MFTSEGCRAASTGCQVCAPDPECPTNQSICALTPAAHHTNPVCWLVCYLAPFVYAQFSHYFMPSVVGIVPGLIIYVWLGSLAADVTEAVAGGGVSTPPAGDCSRRPSVLQLTLLLMVELSCGTV